jgi:hypothetical protein
MTKKKREKPLHLDMSFDEALKRFAQTDPRELRRKKEKKKPTKSDSGGISRTQPTPRE